MIRTDATGTLLEVVETSHPIIGRWFARREPQGDAGDLVRVVGFDQGRGSLEPGTDIEAGLIVTAAEFGSIPGGWESVNQPFGIDEFRDEYALAPEPSPAEAALVALEATHESAARRIDDAARHAVAVELRVTELKKKENGG
jgi:hypothetical protein